MSLHDIQKYQSEISDLLTQINNVGHEFSQETINRAICTKLKNLIPNQKITLKLLLLIQSLQDNDLWNLAINKEIQKLREMVLANAKSYKHKLKLLKVESWMQRVVSEIEIFTVDKEIFEILIKQFLEELKKIFVGKEKFGGEGNLLIADLMFLKKFVEKHVNIDFENVIKIFIKQIKEDCLVDMKEIEDVVNKSDYSY